MDCSLIASAIARPARLQPGWVEPLPWASTLIVLRTRAPGLRSLDHVIERRLARRVPA